MPIAHSSPHFAAVVKRVFPDKDSFGMIERAFDWAMNWGGKYELDFERRPDASYNPRPARVGLILINDAAVLEAQIIAAGLLATVLEGRTMDLSNAAFDRLLGHHIIHIAQLAVQSPQCLFDNPSTDYQQASLICLALRLDRLRHLHQAITKKHQWPNFVKDTEPFIELAAKRSAALQTLLTAWRERFVSQLGNHFEEVAKEHESPNGNRH